MNTIERIEVINREGVTIPMELVSQSGDLYSYKLMLGAWADYIRISYDQDDPSKIIFLDPPGGPMFEIGYKYAEVFDMVLTEIRHDEELQKYVMTFRKVNG